MKESRPRIIMGFAIIASCTVVLSACGSKAEQVATTTSDSVTTAAQPAVLPSPSVPAANVPASGTTASTSPRGVVDSLYKVHQANETMLLSDEGVQLRQSLFDRDLAALLTKSLAPTPEGDVGILDFDPFFNGQDIQVTGLQIGEAKIDGDAATVVVSFNNYDQKNVLTYSLRNTENGWKIRDIDYLEGHTLVKNLTPMP